MMCSIANSESVHYTYIRGKSSPSDWVCWVSFLVQILGEKHRKPLPGASLTIFMELFTDACGDVY